MPRLRKLTLRNIIVCTELSDFFVRHLATLESITMQEFYVLDWWHRNSADHIFWNELFTVLADACTPAPEPPFISPSRPPTRLTHFELCYDEPETEMMDLDNTDIWHGLITPVREKMAAEPDARPFFYATIDDKYGWLVRVTTAALEEFRDGRDYRCWRRLMDVLRVNQNGEV
ncbi:hypothetical protein BDV12DRAFT_200114 [Aspergillus spectabilis]